MDHQRVELVRGLLSGRGEALVLAADLFHRRLFFLAPALEPLFAPDARSRNAAFLAFVHTLVADLDRPDRLLPRLLSLAEAADRAGVTPADIEAARTALVFALGIAAPDTFNFAVCAAWQSIFDGLLVLVQPAPATPRRAAARSGAHRISVPPQANLTPGVTPRTRAAG